MKVGILHSGGKDSTYAAWIASKRAEVVCLITLLPQREDSYMFHHPAISWTKLQAEAIGLPQVLVETEGVKEEELSDLRRAFELARDDYSIEGVYTGALASVYQKSRVERICSELGLDCISPLWLIEPEAHLRNLVKNRFLAIITAVAALGLDENWLGRVIDETAIQELVSLSKRYGLHIGLEGGEGETFVLDCPLFKMRIEVLSSEKHWLGDRGHLEIREARLVEKSLH